EGEDATLAAVVGAQHVDLVLERDDDDERPEDERQHAEDVGGADRHAARGVEALVDGVERAGADVAVDDAEGAERQPGELPPVRMAGSAMGGRDGESGWGGGGWLRHWAPARRGRASGRGWF